MPARLRRPSPPLQACLRESTDHSRWLRRSKIVVFSIDHQAETHQTQATSLDARLVHGTGDSHGRLRYDSAARAARERSSIVDRRVHNLLAPLALDSRGPARRRQEGEAGGSAAARARAYPATLTGTRAAHGEARGAAIRSHERALQVITMMMMILHNAHLQYDISNNKSCVVCVQTRSLVPLQWSVRMPCI